VTVEALPTGQAGRRFGELDRTQAAAALHLTWSARQDPAAPLNA
jgi:hypothetical protein